MGVAGEVPLEGEDPLYLYLEKVRAFRAEGSPAMDLVYRQVEEINNDCSIEQERIGLKTRAFLIREGIEIKDPNDITRAVDIAMTEEWEKRDNIDVRLSHFRSLRCNLGRRNCPLWPEILKSLRSLGNYHVPEEEIYLQYYEPHVTRP